MSKAKNIQLESAVPVPTPDGMESLGGNVFVVKLSQTPGGPAYPVLGKNMMQGTVDYGKKNDFPQQIIRLNNGSPTNAAIIDSKVTYILGKGVIESKPDDAKLVGVPNPSETWDSVINKIARDYCTFGGRCFQVILNNDGVSVSTYHQDYSQVRVGKFTDKGKVETYKISDDWSDSTKKPIELLAWDCNVSSMQKGQAYLFYAFDYRPGLKFYSVPSYYSAMEYIKADGALSLFYNNSIKNGFTGSAVIVMPFNADEKTQKQFYEDLRRNLTGPENGNNVFVVWGENAAGVAPQISPFNASNNADVYNNVQDIVFQSIVSAHRLSSPTLAGISGAGNLSGNASEIIDSFILFNYTVIENLRRVILDDLNKVQRINKRQLLQINELDVVKKIRESESASEQILTIKDGSAGSDNVESLASKLGVGGTQALTAIMSEGNMSDLQKRGLLSVLFGLSDKDIDSLFEATPKPAMVSRLSRTFTSLHKYIRREPKPGGGYNYIYEEPNQGSKKKSTEVAKPSKTAKERAKYLNKMRPLLQKKVSKNVGGININIGFNQIGNKHLYSDTFGRSKRLKKRDLKNLDKALAESKFVKSAPLSKPRKDGISKFYYFKDASKNLYYNVAEKRIQRTSGQIITSRFLYSVTDSLK